ncbi:MAG: hypothetical protein Q8R08_03915 [bacterium]|nr:hypothetical protein [bacterium]
MQNRNRISSVTSVDKSDHEVIVTVKGLDRSIKLNPEIAEIAKIAVEDRVSIVEGDGKTSVLIFIGHLVRCEVFLRSDGTVKEVLDADKNPIQRRSVVSHTRF